MSTREGHKLRIQIAQLAFRFRDSINVICILAIDITVSHESRLQWLGQLSRSVSSASLPQLMHGFKDFLCKASSHEGSNIVVPPCKVAVCPARVLEGLAKCLVVNDVTIVDPSCGPRCNSCYVRTLLGGFPGHELAAGSTRPDVVASRSVRLEVPVSPVSFIAPLLLLLGCTLLFCFTVLLATVICRFCRYRCLTEVLNSTAHPHTSCLRLARGTARTHRCRQRAPQP